jgi:segregation and condensation protein B
MTAMDRNDIAGALEAMLFAAGDPMSHREIKRVFERLWAEEPEERKAELAVELESALTALRERWSDGDQRRGFGLVEVAGGLAFRTNPRFASALQAMRAQRPVRLSRAALETLAIIAYRQPATKPEIDQIRGVDCSATIRLLLDRRLIKIVGKREEPGLPLLYGTTPEFLSFFNIKNLAQLPSLREYHELTDESREELDAFDTDLALEELRNSAKALRPEEEPAVQDLDAAVSDLKSAEKVTRAALAEEGIEFEKSDDGPEESAPDPEPDASS